MTIDFESWSGYTAPDDDLPTVPYTAPQIMQLATESHISAATAEAWLLRLRIQALQDEAVFLMLHNTLLGPGTE